MKVVQFVEGHNFHVDWHFKFWVETGEKLAQGTVPPVHWKWVAFKVDKLVVQNLMRKTPYDLCENCRWHCDLQLSYSKFYACVYKILEFFNFEQWISNTFRPKHRRVTTSRAPARRPASASAPRTAQGHPPPKALSSQCAAPWGSLESSRGLTRCTTPYRLGARREPPVRQRYPAVRAPAKVTVLRRHLRRHHDVTGEASPIKTERLAPIRAPHRAADRHCRPPAELAYSLVFPAG
jgi:hypothetical protein